MRTKENVLKKDQGQITKVNEIDIWSAIRSGVI